jgi:hypothetical protein
MTNHLADVKTRGLSGVNANCCPSSAKNNSGSELTFTDDGEGVTDDVCWLSLIALEVLLFQVVSLFQVVFEVSVELVMLTSVGTKTSPDNFTLQRQLIILLYLSSHLTSKRNHSFSCTKEKSDTRRRFVVLSLQTLVDCSPKIH